MLAVTKSELDKSVLMAWVGSPAQSQISLFLEYSFTRKLVEGRVSRLCALANCHVSSFNSIVIKTIESTDAGNGNNAIEVEFTQWNYFCNHFLYGMRRA